MVHLFVPVLLALHAVSTLGAALPPSWMLTARQAELEAKIEQRGVMQPKADLPPTTTYEWNVAEEQSCQNRDDAYLTEGSDNNLNAILRVTNILSTFEFKNYKTGGSANKPMTPRSVPWPILQLPLRNARRLPHVYWPMDVPAIDEEAIMRFFAEVKRLNGQWEHDALVLQFYKKFDPQVVNPKVPGNAVGLDTIYTQSQRDDAKAAAKVVYEVVAKYKKKESLHAKAAAKAVYEVVANYKKEELLHAKAAAKAAHKAVEDHKLKLEEESWKNAVKAATAKPVTSHRP